MNLRSVVRVISMSELSLSSARAFPFPLALLSNANLALFALNESPAFRSPLRFLLREVLGALRTSPPFKRAWMSLS